MTYEDCTRELKAAHHSLRASLILRWQQQGLNLESILRLIAGYWGQLFNSWDQLEPILAEIRKLPIETAGGLLMTALEKEAHRKLPVRLHLDGDAGKTWFGTMPMTQAELDEFCREARASKHPRKSPLATPKSQCILKRDPNGIWVLFNLFVFLEARPETGDDSLHPADGLARRAEVFGAPMEDEDIEGGLSRCRDAQSRCVALISLLPLVPLETWLGALEKWWTQIADPTGHLQLVVAALASAMYEGHLCASDHARAALDRMAASIDPVTYFSAMSPEAGMLLEQCTAPARRMH